MGYIMNNNQSKQKFANNLQQGQSRYWLRQVVLLFLMCLAFALDTLPLYAEPLRIDFPVKLELKPKQCVVLHQGQKCYADVIVKWQAPQGNVCLYSSLVQEALQCWSQQDKAQLMLEIIATENIIFELRSKPSNTLLGKVELEMAWVYKKGSRSNLSWRMF